jgi:hypothetical protein
MDIYNELDSRSSFLHTQHSEKQASLTSHLLQALVFTLLVFSDISYYRLYQMSTEAAAAIVFGTLQVSISLAALYYQRQAQLRRQQRTVPIPS